MRRLLCKAPHAGNTGSLRRISVSVAAAIFLTLSGPAVPAFAEDAVTEARLLKQLHLIGLSRMARGEPAAAIAPFQVVTEVAPELTQAHHLLATAMVLSDFGRRERALPIVERALAAEPQNGLYNVVRVLADPALSTLRDDGALYFSPAGAQRLQTALAGLDRAPHAYNGRFLKPILGATQSTSDASYPLRLPHFASMIGERGQATLPKYGKALPFGRLFAASISDEQFGVYVRQARARLPQGVASLAMGDPNPPIAPTVLSGQATMELLLDAPRGRRATN